MKILDVIWKARRFSLGRALPFLLAPALFAQGLTFGNGGFLLDGRPFQIRSGEVHPARIPPEYWRHRLRMVKALGCNTVALYVFWNQHEEREGQFDFSTGSRALPRFLRLAQEEGLHVLLRPGPYCCAEWDLGGLPSWLLKTPDIKLRCKDSRFMAAVDRYLTALARVVRPFLAGQGGPILMVQLENEYGSYGGDRAYLEALRAIWTRNGVEGPFYTSDGPAPSMLALGTLPGAAVGLDSGGSDADFALAARVNPRVPAFSGETYPGWLTHWGEAWASVDAKEAADQVRWLLDHGKSFNLYMAHGGTSFGWNAGANSGGKGFEPDVTSYDYDAPIDEQGRPTAKFAAIRAVMQDHLPAGQRLPPIPEPIAAMAVPPFTPVPLASLWDVLPPPIHAVQPVPMEALDQRGGFIVYRTSLGPLRGGGRLEIRDLHDYGLVFLDGVLAGTLDRRLGEGALTLPPAQGPGVLEILVEAFGRINFGEHLVDRKGITDRVVLEGRTLMDWEIFPLPMEDDWLRALRPGPVPGRQGRFFRGSFRVDRPADTFLDLKAWKQGAVWVNGHNLGRYWDLGPQTRLYCPAPWLKAGDNEVVVLDLHLDRGRPIEGRTSLRD